MMAPLVAFVASLLVVAESQGFLSNGADASKTYHSIYNKFITPSLQHVKHGNGPDALSYHNIHAEHGPATDESNKGDKSFMVMDDKPVMPIVKTRENDYVVDKKAENRAVETVLATDSNSRLGLSAIGISLLTFAMALALRMRRVFQPAAVLTTRGAHGSGILIPALGGSIVELESQGSTSSASAESLRRSDAALEVIRIPNILQSKAQHSVAALSRGRCAQKAHQLTMRRATMTPEERIATMDAQEEAVPSVAGASAQDGLPLSMVVGQESIKTALLLASVNRDMGGVLISGGRGTAKSVMARALHSLLPPIEMVKDSKYNIDPEEPTEMDSLLRKQLEAESEADPSKDVTTRLAELEREIVRAPFVQIPLNVMDDMLLGSIDVEESVKQGKSVFQPGLLARAHRGILYVDDINLLDSEATNILLQVISDGNVIVEREGISVRYSCRPLLIATFNPEEGEMRDHLLDRIAVSLSADAAPLDVSQRVEAVDSVLTFAAGGDKRAKAIDEDMEASDALRSRIIFAREEIGDVKLSRDQLVYLCEEAVRAGCQGHRADIYAAEVARASAALAGRSQVDAEDLKLAVKLAIVPRSSFINDAERPPDLDMEPPPPPPPPPQDQMDDVDEDQEDEEQQEPPDQDQEDQEDQDDTPDQEPEEPELPEEFMFDAEGVIIDPELLAFATKQKQGKSGGRGLIFSEDRGRYIKAQLPRGKVRRLAVDATMRASAPYQKPRRERQEKNPQKKYIGRKVFIEEGDVRSKKMARKAGSLIIFVVDASGSMALNRMQAAKGAALSLLTEAYQSRDQIALIPFQGDAADVLVPPTRSIALTKKRLETMACGGGSPLAHALSTAARTGMNAQKSGDVGKVVVVCIGDGRANVPLDVSTGVADPPEPGTKPDRQALKDELIDTAKQLGSLPGFSLLMLDTENKFVSTGLAKDIAEAAQGKYFKLPKTTDGAIADLVGGAVGSMK
jgi:magnesium chelatase subunit D